MRKLNEGARAIIEKLVSDRQRYGGDLDYIASGDMARLMRADAANMWSQGHLLLAGSSFQVGDIAASRAMRLSGLKGWDFRSASTITKRIKDA
jgi:hypothetical protein